MVTWIESNSQFDAMLAALDRVPVVALDFETTGRDPLTCTILLVSISDGQDVWVFPWKKADPSFLTLLASKVVISHNANFEYKFLFTHVVGPLPEKWFCTQVAESIIQAGLREGVTEDGDSKVSLAEVREKYLKLSTDKTLQTSFVGVDASTFTPTAAQIAYAGQDVEGLHEIMESQLRRLQGEGLLRVTRLEMAVILPLAEMELAGFYLNLDKHAEVLRGYVEAEMAQREKVEGILASLYHTRVTRWNEERKLKYDALQAEVQRILPGGRAKKDTPEEVKEAVTAIRQARDSFKPLPTNAFNLGSSQQVWNALAEAGIELYKSEWDEEAADYVQKKTTDKNVVAKEAEKAGANPVLAEYAAWGRAFKVVSTYGESLRKRVHPKTGRIHTRYNQNVSSGRTSSQEPNCQNMPKDIRGCFEAQGDEVLVVADAANQEGRLAAILSRDVNLLTAFREGKDWHKMTASLAYPEKFPTWEDVPKDSPERAGCKNANFSGIYGGTGKTLVDRGYVPTEAIGNKLMEASYAFAPQVRATALRSADKAAGDGWVATISGRKRYFNVPEKPPFSPKSKAWRRYKKRIGSIRRAAMNHPVQGSGADIMKLAMVLLRKPMAERGWKLCAMVHDELVYRGPEESAEWAASLVAEKMEEAAAAFTSLLPIPAEVHVTKVWEK